MAVSLLNSTFKLLEQRFFDTSKYPEKIQLLTGAWINLNQSLKNAVQDSKHLEHANSLVRKSILMLLKAEWKNLSNAMKYHLKTQITNGKERLKRINESLASQCESILEIWGEPWGNLTLKGIFNNAPYEDSAAKEFLEKDRHILKLRCSTLCESKKLYRLAEQLAAVIWRFYTDDSSFLSYLQDDELHYILDLYLVLLINRDDHRKIIEIMKDLPLKLGLQFIKRLKDYQSHPPDDSKVWKKSRKAAEVVALLFVSLAIKGPLETPADSSILTEFLEEWIDMCSTQPEFLGHISTLASKAFAPDHIFALSKSLETKLPGKHLLKCIELFLNGLITEVNQLEELQSTDNAAELRAVEQRLSERFLQLANLLSNSLNECRECILIAFSLNPTTESFVQVQEMALRSGKCKTEILDTGQSQDPTSNQEGTAVLEASVESERIQLELPQNLRDDLDVVLNCPRSCALNWQLNWSDLKVKCEEFLRGQRPVAKELKFLDIDYDLYKHLPINEDENHDGIEKGYEIDNDSGAADDDFDMDEFGTDFTSSPSDAGSDASYSMKKKTKLSLSMDARKKKSRVQAFIKRSCLSSDESKNKANHSDNLVGKKAKSPRKPKGKTPKSDSKRNGKSSVVQLQVSSGKTTKNPAVSDRAIKNTQSNCINYSNVGLTEDVKKIINFDKRKPKNQAQLETLRNYRRKTTGDLQMKLHSKSVSDPRRASGKEQFLDVVPGLISFDMIGRVPQRTTVFQVSGNSSPQSSGGIKPDNDLSSQGTSSDQINGKATNNNQAGNSAGASGEGSHEPSSNLVTPKLVETFHASNRVGSTTSVHAGSAATPVQLGMTPTLTVIRRDAQVLQLQRRASEPSQSWTQSSRSPVATLGSTSSSLVKLNEERISTTALPQFSQAFGFGRQDAPSALKQALLAPDSKPTSSKPNSTAAGFGSQTQPAGFGAPGHPPGFGAQQVPPLQTIPRPSLLPPRTARPEQLLPQQQQQQGLATSSAGTASPTGTSTAQVIVKTSGSTTMLTPVASTPTGLLLAPGLTPVGTPVSLAAVCITTANSTLVSTTGHRSIVMVTTTKPSPTAAAPAAGPPTRQALPAQVQRTSNPSLEKPRVTVSAQSKVEAAQTRTASTATPPGVSVQTSSPTVTLATVPALVQTSSQPALSLESGAAVPASVKRNRSKASNPILGKYLKQTQANALPESPTSTSETPTSGSPTPGTSATSTQGTPTPGAAAAAAAATAAAAAAAANAPSNVSRPLFPSTPPSENDILKAQLLEFESVLHKVHTTQQAKERQSLSEDDVQPSPARPVQTDASVQAGPQSLGQNRTLSTAQATTQTVVQTGIRSTPKAVIPVSVSVSTSCTQTLPQSSISLPNTPKKKAKVTKSLTLTTSTSISVAPEHRATVFKPTMLHTISAPKHISQKITEDEETTARILSILRQYDEQLRCSPEINNKPAPRRRNQAQPGSSPNSKRKHKKSKNSISELSPGTDDTHTMGSEDSSIASHFADGVMEATPTSPLSTCDDRSVASTVTTSGETTLGSVSTSTTMISFAGVTKTSTSTTDSGDTSVVLPPESPSPQTSSTPPIVQVLPKVLPSPKVQVPLKVQTLPKNQVVFKSQTQAKALTIPKVPNPVKVVANTKGQTLTKPSTMLKGQGLSKIRPHPKLPTPSQVTIAPAKNTPLSMLPSTTVASQGISIQTPKDGQVSSVSQMSRVIQSVDSLKSALNLEVENSALPQGQPEPSSNAVPTSSQVSHLARALQSSKQASQTPLLAKALETPATPLPTSFSGILKSQPASSTHVRSVSSLSDVHVVKINKPTLASTEVRVASLCPQVSPIKTSVTVAQTVTSLLQPQSSPSPKSVQTLPKTSQPTLLAPASSPVLLSSTAVIPSSPSRAQPLLEAPSVKQESNPSQSSECGSSLQPVAVPAASPAPQSALKNSLDPLALNTGAVKLQITETLLAPKNEPVSHKQSPSLQQTSPTSKSTTHIVQLVSQPQTVEPISLEQGNLQAPKVPQCVEGDLQAQPASQDTSPSKMVPSISHLLKSTPPSSAQPAIQLQLTSPVLQSSSQGESGPQTSTQALLPVSQAQLTPQMLHSHGQGQPVPLSVSQGPTTAQTLQPQVQASSQVLQIPSHVPVSPSVSQVVVPATQAYTSHVVQSVSHMAQTAAQIAQPANQTQTPQIFQATQAGQVTQPALPQLVQSCKPSQTTQQRYGIQPVQLSSATQTSSLRRVVHTSQSGECTTHLIQVSQPQPLLSSPAVSLSQSTAVTYSGLKHTETEGSKVISPTKQNLVYMVPSSSASQLPVMVPSGAGVVHVVNSQSGNVQVPVVVQVSKQADVKLTRDASRDHFVISCDSSQPLLLATSTIQQLLSGSTPVVSAAHLCSAMSTATTATGVASSAPLFSVASAVDSSVVTDTTVFSQGSTHVSSDPSAITLPNSVSQTYTSVSTPTSVAPSTTVLDVPSASQPLPRAITPSSASSVVPPTNTSPSSAPTRPTTLLALQKQQQIQIAQLQLLRSQQIRQQEEEDKQQKLQTIRRLTQLQQQQQQQQQQPSSTEVSQHPIVQVDLDQTESHLQLTNSQLPQQQTLVSSLPQGQLESPLLVQKLTQGPTPIPLQSRNNSTITSPVVIPKIGRPSLIAVTPQYKKTEPTQLKQLLEQSPAPLPPQLRRLSYSNVVSLSPSPVSEPSTTTPSFVKDYETNLRSETSRETVPCVAEDDKLSSFNDNKEEMKQQKLSPEKFSASSPALKQLPSTAQEKLFGSLLSEELPTTLPLPETLLCPVEETPVTVVEKESSVASEKQPQSAVVSEKQPPKKLNPTVLQEKTCPVSVSENRHLTASDEKLPLVLTSEWPTSNFLEEKQPTLFSPNKNPSSPTAENLHCTALPEQQTAESQVLPKLIVQNSLKAPAKESIHNLKKPAKIYKQAAKPPVKISLRNSSKTFLKTGSCVEGEALDQSTSENVTVWGSSSQKRGEVLLSSVGATVPSQSLNVELKPMSDQRRGDVAVSSTSVAAVAETAILRREAYSVNSEMMGSEQALQPLVSTQSLKLMANQIQKTSVAVTTPHPSVGSVLHTPSDLNVNSRRLSLSPLPESKPFNASELRVYPPSDKTQAISKLKTPMPKLSSALGNLPAVVHKMPSNRSSTFSPVVKVQTSVPISFCAGKSPSLAKVQTSFEAYAQPLTQTTVPLQVTKPTSFKAQAVIQPPLTFQLQTLQSSGCSGQASKQQSTVPFAETVHQQVCSSDGIQKSMSSNAPKRQRQRSKKKNNSHFQMHESSPVQISPLMTETASSSPPALLPDATPQPSSPTRLSGVDHSSSKRSPKKRKDSKDDINSALVSKHISDSIMRVSLFVENESQNELSCQVVKDETHDELSVPILKDETCDELSTQIVKDVYYEGQENIPVEVAVAALCGEDIEVAKDLIEGNLQGDIKTRGAITLLPADPSDSAEELNFTSYRNVTQKTLAILPELHGGGSNASLPVYNSCAASEEQTVISFSNPSNNYFNNQEIKEEDIDSVIQTEPSIQCSSNSLVIKSDELKLELELSSVKKGSEEVCEIKEEDATSTEITQKCVPALHAGLFSEQSRSLSGSEDLSMDKTIFPPETDILLETTLSPSFLGEIAQMSPSSSQDAVSASPEPIERKKRCFMVKSGLSNRAHTSVYESLSEPVPKLEHGDANKLHPKDENSSNASSSLGNLSQFNGANTNAEVLIDSTSNQCASKSEYDFLDASVENQLAHNFSADDQLPSGQCQESTYGSQALPLDKQGFASLSSSSTVSPCISSLKSACGSADSCVDEPPWENQPLYVLPSQADNEEDPFWQSTLTTEVEVSLNLEGDTNSSSTPSDCLSKRSLRRSSTQQTRKAGVKRKEDFSSSPGKKHPGDKRKRISALVSSQDEDESTLKIGSILRSSAAKVSAPVRRDVSKLDVPSKEDAHVSLPRRVSSRTPKPVTKFDGPHRKPKSSTKSTPKTGPHKKK